MSRFLVSSQLDVQGLIILPESHQLFFLRLLNCIKFERGLFEKVQFLLRLHELTRVPCVEFLRCQLLLQLCHLIRLALNEPLEGNEELLVDVLLFLRQLLTDLIDRIPEPDTLAGDLATEDLDAIILLFLSQL